MKSEILTISEVSKLYKRSEGAIRTALWRHRQYGVDPGFPLPVLIGGKLRWLRSAVKNHLKGLSKPQTSAEPPPGGRPPPFSLGAMNSQEAMIMD